MHGILKLIGGAALALALLFSVSAPVQAGSDVVSSGTFRGASKHVTSGGITVVKTATGTLVILDQDFSLDGAPDPKLGFGKDGKYDTAAKIAHLSKKTGLQVYKVPAGVDASKYNEFYVWCEKFSVPLGVASLK